VKPIADPNPISRAPSPNSIHAGRHNRRTADDCGRQAGQALCYSFFAQQAAQCLGVVGGISDVYP
jgi:hypothetical protein